ncbi:MAG TPA: acyltransferase [Deltaproteobacteria bacterium]|nr:MAG: hypothetical protein A2Z79_08990 [Deltaproteobacteria bacterium GWA2_55_82]OGQ64602.1 MAG: hypothetical protein A3I81_11255 [Deltaproteobacteria bacterium RIFCSPLOWO2_02_FULL_55_12]OIJ73700.1 MAG: hypothetical protein A2V21_305125 [Deltaproteobacteria bacterium GWC2_55_46]HBG45907.1 acyltransferase [Deltaproteobacteria bacterium]HCY09674.1 acyltransferase [Deltaproteobacteria bacterium]
MIEKLRRLFGGGRKVSFALRGANVRIMDGFYFSNPEAVALGDNVYIGRNFYMSGKGKLTIGSNVIISDRCSIMTSQHDYKDADALPYGTGYVHSPVTIRDNVWIGMNASILPGVEIGEGAVIGFGAVVRKDIPPMSIAIGNPAVIVSKRDEAKYRELLAAKRFLLEMR